ncbi:hypothetical protein BUALT_Bualt17G0026800 [Buddleja alternifolia]|uniref:TPX2 C-terminal domain-containing protein n=1 Tax=Buddleja alternifolia TaxID=168488 RepID=A0AAV6WG97_9LAMI|nr:hypothetical protein BUALT_Bualt17G0026800 [Buddleja alternifolia]
MFLSVERVDIHGESVVSPLAGRDKGSKCLMKFALNPIISPEINPLPISNLPSETLFKQGNVFTEFFSTPTMIGFSFSLEQVCGWEVFRFENSCYKVIRIDENSPKLFEQNEGFHAQAKRYPTVVSWEQKHFEKTTLHKLMGRKWAGEDGSGVFGISTILSAAGPLNGEGSEKEVGSLSGQNSEVSCLVVARVAEKSRVSGKGPDKGLLCSRAACVLWLREMPTPSDLLAAYHYGVFWEVEPLCTKVGRTEALANGFQCLAGIESSKLDALKSRVGFGDHICVEFPQFQKLEFHKEGVSENIDIENPLNENSVLENVVSRIPDTENSVFENLGAKNQFTENIDIENPDNENNVNEEGVSENMEIENSLTENSVFENLGDENPEIQNHVTENPLTENMDVDFFEQLYNDENLINEVVDLNNEFEDGAWASVSDEGDQNEEGVGRVEAQLEEQEVQRRANEDGWCSDAEEENEDDLDALRGCDKEGERHAEWNVVKEIMAESYACLTRSFSQPSPTSSEDKKGNPLQRALTTSISFGRFMSESLDWEKWSAFTHNRYLEEVEKYSKPGSVAEKKAYFEAHYKRRRAAALLEQQNAAATDFSESNTTNRIEDNASSDLDFAQSRLSVVTENIKEEEVQNSNQFCPVSRIGGCEIERKIEDAQTGCVGQVIEPSVLMENPVELTNHLENGGEIGDVVSKQEYNVCKEDDSTTRNSVSPREKKPEVSSSKLLTNGGASKHVPSIKPTMPVRLRNSDKTPTSKNNARDLSNKRRSNATPLHMSINFASCSGETRKPTSPNTSVSGIFKHHSATLPPENRTITVDVQSQSPATNYSKSSSAFGSKARSPTVSSSFTFKSEERAAKRKEFFEKLEQKSKSKETEKQQLSAKSQIPAVRPCSPKIQDRAAFRVQDNDPRPPWKVSGKIEGSKDVTVKNNRPPICSAKSFWKKSTRENASPNIQL